MILAQGRWSGIHPFALSKREDSVQLIHVSEATKTRRRGARLRKAPSSLPAHGHIDSWREPRILLQIEDSARLVHTGFAGNAAAAVVAAHKAFQTFQALQTIQEQTASDQWRKQSLPGWGVRFQSYETAEF